MPRREATFMVNAPPQELWKFIRDFEALCTCIPGVERIHLVDDRTVDLTVREKIGVVPMILELRAQIESEQPPHGLRAVAQAEHLRMEIDVALREQGAATELLTVFDVKGEGQLKAIVDRLFERRATERTAQFAESLQGRFGAVSAQPAPTPAPAPATAGWLERLRRRLREWRRVLQGR